MPKWTAEQQAAIDARECNLLVAAAAGSGKTAVLVERILQLIIKDGVDLDRLLVVTFTNAAAGEMRERIGSALMKAIDEISEDNGQGSENNENKNRNNGSENNESSRSRNSEIDSEHLRRQLNLLTKASISTLHSFCIRVIRKYFHVIDLDPGFRIGDETECSLLKLEVIEELFESEYEKASDAFLGLVERFSDNRQDVALQELVLRLYNFIQSKPFPQEWLEERIQEFAKDIHQLKASTWVQALLSSIEMETQGIIDILQEALSLCQRPYGPVPYQENLLDDLQQMNDILISASGKNFQACSDAYQQTKFSRLKSCKKGEVDDSLKERAKDLRDQAKDAWKSLGGGILTKSLEQSVSQLNELYPYMQCLCDLVLEFDRQFGVKKQEKGIIDFNDLEHFALDILQHEQVAEELQYSYDYIFIDEYQDSNLVQDTILSYVRKKDNMFMVGDVKQSIYRFRLADPTIFLEKYDSYKAGEGQLDRRIDLNRNFRSRPYILDGVNYLFEHLMSTKFGELEYDDTASLYPGLNDDYSIENQSIELHLVEKTIDEDEELDADIEDLSDVEVEATIAADRIQKLIGTEIYDAKKEKYRKVDYSDIVVLLRSTKMQAPVYQEVFTAKGIPVYADSNTGYFEAQEVKTIVALLKVIDNKLQDIPLLTVMRSPIGSFNADDMILIRTKGKGRAFYQAVHEYKSEQDDELAQRLHVFFNKIEGWQKAARYLSMEDFIWLLYRESGYYAYVSVMPGGTQRQA
ncbi:MAG: helicase-exonuclease AddAB subunit AddA, partial [Clostridiales bacterium]|nr:helicase-exonuclease AddAB subunit AddA [Clostridiales bacterium]